MNGLFTVGYEATTLELFIEQLLESRVEVLIDVRDYPLSRKKGFSKHALANALNEVGVAYEHWRQLGAPKAIRNQLKDTKDWQAYVQGYSHVLDEQESTLVELAARAEASTVCLMCFERDYRECHRSLVTNRLFELKSSLPATHLAPKLTRLANAA